MGVFGLASKIKIRVVDEKNNFRLRLPSIPFWLITSSLSLALRFKPVIMRNINDSDEDTKALLEILDSGMIKDLIHELKANGKFDLVDLSTGDGTIVRVSIL